MDHHMLVAGATGLTGRIIVNKLIKTGVKPLVLVRNLEKAQNLFGDAVEFHQGDLREPETLLSALSGIKTVISAVGTRTPVGKNCPKKVDFEGVANLVHAAELKNVQRFILISSIAVTHPEHPLNCFGKILDWKFKGEEVLRQSGLNYTIIRPGGLKDNSTTGHALFFDQGDQISGMINRSAVAEICLNALQYPQSHCTTFEAIETDQPGRSDWIKLFTSLEPAC